MSSLSSFDKQVVEVAEEKLCLALKAQFQFTFDIASDYGLSVVLMICP